MGKMDMGMQKIQCESKPYYLCLDDSSGAWINTACRAPGAQGPLQEADISKLSIMDEKRSVRVENKGRRKNERMGDRARGEGHHSRIGTINTKLQRTVSWLRLHYVLSVFSSNSKKVFSNLSNYYFKKSLLEIFVKKLILADVSLSNCFNSNIDIGLKSGSAVFVLLLF